MQSNPTGGHRRRGHAVRTWHRGRDNKLGAVGNEADQYSLAVAYAELRSGYLPFAQADMMNLMLGHMKAKPDLAALPEAEQQVLHKVLAKKPRERYGSCREFVLYLEAAPARVAADQPRAVSRGRFRPDLAGGRGQHAGAVGVPADGYRRPTTLALPMWVAGILLLMVAALLSWRLLTPTATLVASGMPASWDVEQGRAFRNTVHVEHRGIEGGHRKFALKTCRPSSSWRRAGSPPARTT